MTAGSRPRVLRHVGALPVATIFENLEAGVNIDDILEWYDGPKRDQAEAVIEFVARSYAGGRPLNARSVRSVQPAAATRQHAPMTSSALKLRKGTALGKFR